MSARAAAQAGASTAPAPELPAPDPAEAADAAPGRVCPLRYRHGPAAIARAPERAAEVLYVVGGLYGNRAALDALDALLAAEAAPPRVCFNGDFHWFDGDDAAFDEVCRRVLAHEATLGNVEAEFDSPGDAGCGCAYPAHVDAGVVARSNLIHARLKATAARHPAWRARLAALPMVARYRVGGCRVGVVHGDAHSLAGWAFDAPALADPAAQPALRAALAAAAVDVFASTHTCTPALHRVGEFEGEGTADRDGTAGLGDSAAAAAAGWIVNNGAAGMPSFAPGPDGALFGLVTRIATTPPPVPALHGVQHAGVHVALLPLRYDGARWCADFLAQWPPGSDAWLSYFERISRGTALDAAAWRDGVVGGTGRGAGGSAAGHACGPVA